MSDVRDMKTFFNPRYMTVFFNVSFEISLQFFLSLLFTPLTGPHIRARELKAYYLPTLSTGNCYLFSCLRASFKDTHAHTTVSLHFCGFKIRADSRTNIHSHKKKKTKNVYKVLKKKTVPLL